MNITVNTDASFSNKHKVGSYAFWITCNLGRVRVSGKLKGRIENPSEAEMKCIINALKYLMVDNRHVYNQVSRIYVNTDSMDAKHLFEGEINKLRKFRKITKNWQKIRNIFLNNYLNKIKKDKKEIFFYHVKSHSGVQDSRSYVNEWCDKAAKQELGKILLTLEKPTHDEKMVS